MRSDGARLRKVPPARRRADSVHWLFRSNNIPRRRRSLLPSDIRKRNFFGMGEVVAVLFNPKDTLRSLIESRRLLDEARQELSKTQDDSQLYFKPKMSRFSGYFPREEERCVIERALNGEPSFTVIFGASLVGKTAMLREILSCEQYHVLHFDLRLAGFADLQSLYTSLSQQMELFFVELANMPGGYRVFETEAWSFKYERLNIERRGSDVSSGASKVTTSDIAKLMELFQGSLLKYSEFTPSDEGSDQGSDMFPRRESDSTDKTFVEPNSNATSPKRRWAFRFSSRRKNREGIQRDQTEGSEKERPKSLKKIPVLFFDEAHMLPNLIQSTETMKCLLDSMLVLTKQDRLCHIIHATSDPFYQTTLRQLNVMQHCKIITIGDCSKSETRAYFRERLLTRVPERLQGGLDFETLYDAFGGKLAHWHDYITDYVDSKGSLDIKRSSHFLQAHSFLNLHIIHSSQASSPPPADGEQQQPHNRSTDTVHPGLGPAGLKVYSPTSPSPGPNMKENENRATTMVAGYYEADFTAMQLLKVMSRLTRPGVTYLSYFLLCREIGVRAIDGMVRGKVLDLRWTETVTKEGVEERRDGPRNRRYVTSSGTLIDGVGLEDDAIFSFQPGQEPIGDVVNDEELDEGIVGPKLVPVTPLMRYAMREVVQEYEDVQSVSEYASLSDVDEY